ncbi:hypothetical protein AYO39_01000 [Actinobacteria bacterium SCGC AG-212-D09]|nr:hypothetical protein AYO39_01000 [Actinobacteria bacterium SCGC AG-212-D09]
MVHPSRSGTRTRGSSAIFRSWRCCVQNDLVRRISSIAKHRNGPVGEIILIFQYQHSVFMD